MMVIYFIRLLLFVVSFYGISIFVKQKLKIEKEFSLAISVLLIILILFIASLLNILKVSSIIIFVLGIISVIYSLVVNKDKKQIPSYKTVIILFFLIYLAILGTCFEITSYDNFSHWGLIVKQLYLYDTLPSFEYNLVEFTTYPPGSAMFLYYFGLIVGKNEHSMLIANIYLSFILLTPLMVFIRKSNKIFDSLIFIIFSLFILNCNISLSELLVDTILGILGIFSVTIAYFYRKDIKKATILLTIISLSLMIIKTSGILFVALNVILLILLGINNRKIKKTIIYMILMLFLCTFILFLWQSHLKMVYIGDSGLTTKHSLSLVNFERTLSHNGISQSKEVLVKYLKNFYNLDGNIINSYIIGLNIFVVINMFLTKKIKENLKLLILINSLYICYWGCLGIMYILSMPYAEAIRLACYNRYMMSCIVTLFGIVYISVLDTYFKRKNGYYSLLVIVLLIVIIFLNPINSFESLLGIGNRATSDKEFAKGIVNTYDITDYRDRRIIFYFDCNYQTYYSYLLKYEYFYKNIEIQSDDLDFNKLEHGTIIITPDDSKDLDEKGLKIIKENVYEYIK